MEDHLSTLEFAAAGPITCCWNQPHGVNEKRGIKIGYMRDTIMSWLDCMCVFVYGV